MGYRGCLATMLLIYTILALFAISSNDVGVFVGLWMIAGLVAGVKASRLRDAIWASIVAPFVWNFTLGLFIVTPKLLGPPGKEIDIVLYPVAAVAALFGFSIGCATIAALVASFTSVAKSIVTGLFAPPQPPPPPPPPPPRVDRCAVLMEEVKLVERELEKIEDEAYRL